MKNMTLECITEVCGGVYYGSEADKKKEIAGAVIDSRQVESGYLFIAVKGEKVDGHQFIPQVFEKGALAVLSEQELSDPAGPSITWAISGALMLSSLKPARILTVTGF